MCRDLRSLLLGAVLAKHALLDHRLARLVTVGLRLSVCVYRVRGA